MYRGDGLKLKRRHERPAVPARLSAVKVRVASAPALGLDHATHLVERKAEHLGGGLNGPRANVAAMADAPHHFGAATAAVEPLSASGVVIIDAIDWLGTRRRRWSGGKGTKP